MQVEVVEVQHLGIVKDLVELVVEVLVDRHQQVHHQVFKMELMGK